MNMTELNPLYTSTTSCPICEKQIEVTKVRSKYVRLVSQDEDYCPHYEGLNPIFYEAWICSCCGYAAHSTVFSEATFHDCKCVREKITPKWTSRSFNGERDIRQALEAFKIVLYNLQVRGAAPSEFAKVCLRIAWLYRYNGEWVNECKFLKFAYDYYRNAYTGEHLGQNKPDEYTLMFIIGELARRLDLKEEAISWFGRVISASARHDEKKKIQPRLLEETRDLIALTRDAMKAKEAGI
jgi:uncharacterized protein (DUF2225 family)